MSKALRVAYGVGVVGLVPVLSLGLLAWTGSLTAPPALGLPDSGSVTRWGLPISRALRDLSATLTIGALVLAATVLPVDSRGGSERGGAQARTVNVAAASGFVWVWSGLAALAFTYSDLAGVSAFAPGSLDQIRYFATNFDLGRWLLVSVTLAALATVGSIFARRVTSVGVLALVALVALWPLANTGHAAGGLNHDIAANAQAVHLLGVTVWAGGLAVLLLVRGPLGGAVPTVVARFSTLAGWCFVLVAGSGTVMAVLRVESWSGLRSEYGFLLGVKVAALVLVGAAGWQHRRRTIPQLAAPQGGGRAFARLAAVELAIMAAAMGTAVALSRTPPPNGGEKALTTAESLLGYPLPPALDAAGWFTQWRIDTLWAPMALLGLAWYLMAVARLRRRGDRWPLGRTVSWVVACAMLVWATSGAPGVYGNVLFSMHMVQHMTLAIGVPSFLVLGAPVTLALRTCRVRRDGSRGPREWLLAIVHSRLMTTLGHPLVAPALFVGSLVVFYNTPLFELSLRSHTVHIVMVLHFIVTGYLFASVVCGVDPGPKRPPFPLRVLLLMVTFGFHAFFAVSLMSSTTVLAESWFTSLGRAWGSTVERDQYVGASLGWALGDYPLVVLGGVLIWQWVRADTHEARRFERKAARDGGSDHREYNDYLRKLHETRSSRGDR